MTDIGFGPGCRGKLAVSVWGAIKEKNCNESVPIKWKRIKGSPSPWIIPEMLKLF